jgi:hypothetical protein
VRQVEESRDLFIINEMRGRLSNKPLIYNSFLNITFGTEITIRPFSVASRCGAVAEEIETAEARRCAKNVLD